MTSPRDTHLTNLEPNAPFFPRRIATPGQPSLSKFSGVEDQYNDIVRQPTAVASLGSQCQLAMDVPVTVRRARFVLENLVVTLTAANDYGSVKIVDLPDRNFRILQAELVGTLVAGGDFASGDDPAIGIGTAAASATPLATTMQNVIARAAQTNIDPAVANNIALSFLGATGDAANLNVADAAGNALYFNADGVDTQLAADGTLTFNGTLDIWYIDLGNVGS